MYKAVDTYGTDKDSEVCILIGNHNIWPILHFLKEPFFSNSGKCFFSNKFFVNTIISVVDICSIFINQCVNIQSFQYTIFNVHLGRKWDSFCVYVNFLGRKLYWVSNKWRNIWSWTRGYGNLCLSFLPANLITYNCKIILHLLWSTFVNGKWEESILFSKGSFCFYLRIIMKSNCLSIR